MKMAKETLRKLVDVHNILFNITVTGDAVIPMAQALVLLQDVIGSVSNVLKAHGEDADAAANNEIEGEN